LGCVWVGSWVPYIACAILSATILLELGRQG